MHRPEDRPKLEPGRELSRVREFVTHDSPLEAVPVRRSHRVRAIYGHDEFVRRAGRALGKVCELRSLVVCSEHQPTHLARGFAQFVDATGVVAKRGLGYGQPHGLGC